MNLSVKVAGLTWQNPVTVASGTFGSGREYAEYVDINRLGAITTKGVSPVPWAGNRTPRVAESYGGMLNSIGLQNPGVEQFIANDMDFFREVAPLIIVNVCGHKIEDYCHVARRLSQEDGIDMLELNISCPNISEGGVQFGTNWKLTESVVREVRKATRLPLIVKLTPNVTDIEVIAKAAEGAGADALSMINTLFGMRIDIKRRRPVLGNIFGGLSGPAIKPVALRCVYQVARCTKIPIIGMGGIMTGDDAIEFIMAGATAVAVGTANFANPRATMDVLEGIEDFMSKNGIDDIKDIIGAAL
ncbi:MAG: dihydroorotate dehydrogenase [Clostridiales bacterium]|jgi:dihydroorotate dehydrogenase (NAD+) catalytic subunit|nr:dihydroorotate dehydrogenase [Clostridiales bacterium]